MFHPSLNFPFFPPLSVVHPRRVSRFVQQRAREDAKTPCRSQLSPPTYIQGMSQVPSFGAKHLYLLSHLTSPINFPS